MEEADLEWDQLECELMYHCILLCYDWLVYSKSHLVPFLPDHPIIKSIRGDTSKSFGTVSSAPWGSAAILPISWAYIKMMGAEGLRSASEVSMV